MCTVFEQELLFVLYILSNLKYRTLKVSVFWRLDSSTLLPSKGELRRLVCSGNSLDLYVGGA